MYPIFVSFGIYVCLVAAVPRPTNFCSASSSFGFSINARIEASVKYFFGFVYFSSNFKSDKITLFQSKFLIFWISSSADCSLFVLTYCFQPALIISEAFMTNKLSFTLTVKVEILLTDSSRNAIVNLSFIRLYTFFS